MAWSLTDAEGEGAKLAFGQPQTDNVLLMLTCQPRSGVVRVSMAAPEGSVITVYAPKGGVGTSMVAVNLAVALQRPEAKVALIDASLQYGNVDVMLNLHASRSIADISQTINDLDADLLSTVITPHPSGVKTLLAPNRPELADLVQPDHLQRIVDEMRLQFDYIVIDTASTLSDLTLTALDIADRVILLTVAEVPAIKNTRVFFQVTEALGYPSQKMLLVLNQVESRNPITSKLIEDNLKHKVLLQIPHDADTVAQSIRRGLPLVTEQRNKPIAAAIHQLAERLAADLKASQEAAAEEAALESAARKRTARFFRQ
jgi:pilus assembly protein CpaE